MSVRCSASPRSPLAPRIPSAIGKSKLAPSLRTSAGARLIVVFWSGKKNALLLMAARMRSRDSRTDRKSTRLNSSHRCISYAVFCLKKKNTIYVCDELVVLYDHDSGVLDG